MVRAYDFLLRLYPREHRATFGAEMRNVFADASAEQRGRGWLAYSCFLFSEFAGLLLGSGRQWLLQTSRGVEAPVLEGATADPGMPADVAQARQRISNNLRRMEHAIANHQFTQARFFSEVDRREREHLKSLCEQHGISFDR